MGGFAIGDTVQVTGPTMAGSVGTVVHLDDRRGLILVRVGGSVQDWFAPDRLALFRP